MWKEVFDGETAVDRMPESYSAEDGDSCPSRRVSAASDDSFDASSYIHVDNKLNSKMPKCLLTDENSNLSLENHFSKEKTQSNGHDVTKSGKRVIRKRLSVSQFNAVRLNAKNNVNNDLSTSSSSDSDSLPKSKKRSTDILSAKIQHLLFEMKRLRQLDRDILRQFLIINDTIEEQRWMVEEKQEAIKRSLSEEGEDLVNFDLVPEVPEEQEDDEESIQSVLSRQNSGTEIFEDTPPLDDTPLIREPDVEPSKDQDLVSTSSDSALSMSGASSTLSSTTSLPVSNRSSSPPTSNFSTASVTSSVIDVKEKKTTAVEIIPAPRTETTYENDFEGDIEGYYRMHGASMKRGSYPFPRQAHSFDTGTNHPYDDSALDSAYSTRRGSTDSDSRDAAEYALAVRRSIINRSYVGPFRSSNNDPAHPKPRPRSASTSTEAPDARNRVQRISVRPDGSHEPPMGAVPNKRIYSANDKSSAAYRLLHHPAHQRHLARFNMNRQVAHLSFVPIAEQEPDMMYENGRLYSNDSDSSSKFDLERRDYQNLIDLSRSRQVRPATRQCPPVMRKPSAAGSAGSLTSSSSRTSSSSLASSSSNSSLHSPTKFVINEADRCRTTQDQVWVQRRRHSAKTNDYIAIPHNKAFPAAYTHKYCKPVRNGVHNLPDPKSDKSRGKLTKRSSMPHVTSYRPNPESDRVLTVSYKPTKKGANEAVYNWIQTQDDVTYL